MAPVDRLRVSVTSGCALSYSGDHYLFDVLRRAEQVLDELEAGQHGAFDAEVMADRLPLFDCYQKAQDSRIVDDKIAKMLDGLEPDILAPREALDVIYRLKTMRLQQTSLFSRKK